MIFKKKLGSITIPNYPRRIQLSKAQRPKYWEWDGVTIKCKSKKLLQKYINQDCRQNIIFNSGKVLPHQLKKPYKIIGFKGDKVYNRLGVGGEFILNSLTTSQLKKSTKYFLCEEIEDGLISYSMIYKKVLANPKQAGTPKIHIISGQDFHVGLNPHIRTKLVDTLHEFYYDFFKGKSLRYDWGLFRNSLNKNYPLIIEMEIRDTVKSQFDNTKKGNGKHWDVGNRALPYMKTFLDFLDKGHKDIEPFIVDDDRLHISGGNNSFFTPIEEGETRELVFHFYSDTREIFKKYLQ